LARRLWPVREIPGARYGLLHLRITHHRGDPLVLPDGSTVRPGATIGELHCNNIAMLQLVHERRNPFAACRQDLRTLSNWLEQDELGGRIEALYACTILAAAASRLGFTIYQRPMTLRGRLEKFFFKGLLLLYNQEGLRRIQHGNTPDTDPADIWLSRRELLRRYGDGQTRDPISRGPTSSAPQPTKP